MPTKSQVISTYLDILRGEIGVRESNDNSGKRVQEYQASTTLGGSHWPWCAALPSWAFRQMEKKTGIKIPWSHSASCDVIWADGKARGLIRSSPQVGDVGLVKARRGSGYSTADAIHIFIVKSVGQENVTTIEGNTNSSGGREGIGVMGHVRPISERFVWIRWIDAVELQEPLPLPWKIRVKAKGAFHFLKPILDAGTNYIATGDIAKALGVPVVWNGNENSVLLDGREVGTQPRLVGGRSFFTTWVLAEHLGLTVTVDSKARMVTLG